MKNPNCHFETELDKLLKEYLGDEGFDRLNLDLKPKKTDDGISDKINNFYKEQLHINLNSCSERIKIDRTITFSQKKLEPNKFFTLLLELGRVCISGGKLPLATEIFRKAVQHSNRNIYKAESLIGLAEVYGKRANWSRSIATIAEAETLFRLENDNKGMAKCENMLGIIFRDLGDVENAQNHFRKSLSLTGIGEVTEPGTTADLEMNLGILENIKGNSSRALDHLNTALKLYGKTDNYKGVAEVSYYTGKVYLERKEYNSAFTSFDEGIIFAKKGKYLTIICMLYQAKSQVLTEMKAFYYAAEFADMALEISHAIDDKLTLANIYKQKGILERCLNNYQTAESYLLNSLRINTNLKNENNIAETALELALLYGDLNNLQSKSFYLKSSLNYYKEINALAKINRIEEMLADAA